MPGRNRVEDATIGGRRGDVNDLTPSVPGAIIRPVPTRTSPRERGPAMPTLAVLFDFDGVIADTENVHIAAWERTFGLMGWGIPPEDCARAAEMDDRAFLSAIFAAKGVEGGDVEGWVARKQETTLAMLSDCPRVYPGVRELVHSLAGIARLGVVSTTWRANIEAVLRALGMSEAFAVLVGKEDVKVPKPDPQGYRLALKTLKVKPGDAVALEDSATGLAAARAAGIRALAIGHRAPEGVWSEGVPYVPGFGDRGRLAELLRLPQGG